jgi:hypothetical protein
MARHILRQRARLKHPSSKGDAAVVGTAEGSDLESES